MLLGEASFSQIQDLILPEKCRWTVDEKFLWTLGYCSRCTNRNCIWDVGIRNWEFSSFYSKLKQILEEFQSAFIISNSPSKLSFYKKCNTPKTFLFPISPDIRVALAISCSGVQLLWCVICRSQVWCWDCSWLQLLQRLIHTATAWP